MSGPIQVIHKLKAKVDCKGSKTDLSLKQGDLIEIVRISDNPEGRWLGRSREGSCECHLSVTLCVILPEELVRFITGWSGSGLVGPVQACLVRFSSGWSGSILAGPVQSCLVRFSPGWSGSGLVGLFQAWLVRFHPGWSGSVLVGQAQAWLVRFRPGWSGSVLVGQVQAWCCVDYSVLMDYCLFWSVQGVAFFGPPGGAPVID